MKVMQTVSDEADQPKRARVTSSDEISKIANQRERRDQAFEATNRILANRVRAARADCATWPALADAMGMTRQGLRLFLERDAKARGEHAT